MVYKEYYPIGLDIRNKNCLVIGGGNVGTRKVLRLLEFKAKVTVISPIISPSLEKLHKENKIIWIKREYNIEDIKLSNYFLIFAATDNEKTNSKIAFLSKKNNKIINVSNPSKESNFILPALYKNNCLMISIFTSGIAPGVSKFIKDEIKKIYGERYLKLINIFRYIRKRLYKEINDPKIREKLLKSVDLTSIMFDINNNKEKKPNYYYSLIFKRREK